MCCKLTNNRRVKLFTGHFLISDQMECSSRNEAAKSYHQRIAIEVIKLFYNGTQKWNFMSKTRQPAYENKFIENPKIRKIIQNDIVGRWKTVANHHHQQVYAFGICYSFSILHKKLLLVESFELTNGQFRWALYSLFEDVSVISLVMYFLIFWLILCPLNTVQYLYNIMNYAYNAICWSNIQIKTAFPNASAIRIKTHRRIKPKHIHNTRTWNLM